jgi:hypothetical protein
MVHARTRITHAEDKHWMLAFLRGDSLGYAAFLDVATTGDEKSFRRTFGPGNYIAQVTSWDEEYGLYDLELVSDCPCRDDRFEDNDALDEAVPTPPGTIDNLRGCYLDVDVFSLEATAGQTLHATIVTEPYSGSQSRSFRLNGPEGTPIAMSSAQEDSVVLHAVALESGTHYVSAVFLDDGVHYRIEIEITD